ncbi:MAG: UvrD-helicase domain-containing protein [Christensenellaceae bacterium]|nr:UvrD-helicase domain-containing protein [Christensenellaceae bacterium]
MSKVDVNELNSEQQAALFETLGPVLVTAGAGSGKTRLLIYRIAYLIEHMNVEPRNILAITFTNKAANEMSERLNKMLDGTHGIWISTFHAMCSKILRSHIINLKSKDNNEKGFDNNFSIYTDTDSNKVLKEVCAKFNFNEDKQIRLASWHISNAKNNNQTPWEYLKNNQEAADIEIYTKIYTAYQVQLKNNNALDFDDLLTKTYELFVSCPDILNHYQNRFLYIHVDEFQDTNTVQYQIVKLLGAKHRNVFVVGDEDQCIYGWRGANISNIGSFMRDFDGCKVFKLERNYRSSKQILKVANNLIKNNQSRIEKVLWTENDDGAQIEQYAAADEYKEAEFVAANVYNLVNSGKYKYGDIAVLMRLNALTHSFEEKFLNYNIPHIVLGGQKFFDRLEIKNLIAYLRILVNPQDSAALMRIINYPKRNIGDTTVEALKTAAEAQNVSPLEIIINSDEYMLSDTITMKLNVFKSLYKDIESAYKDSQPYDAIEHIVKKTGIKNMYNTKSEEDISRIANIDEFLTHTYSYFETNPGNTMGDYLQSISLISDIDTYDDKNNAVALATVHAVKGLEFKVVFVVGLEQGVFPIIRQSGGDLEEERRLMYVAITRAKERLYLTHAMSRALYNERRYTNKSQFLDELSGVDKKTVQAMDAYNLTNFTANKMSFSVSAINTPKKVDANGFTPGKQVLHTKYGIGIIVTTDTLSNDRCITVDFKGIGMKSLSIDYAPIKLL